jgi:hypothetical protein
LKPDQQLLTTGRFGNEHFFAPRRVRACTDCLDAVGLRAEGAHDSRTLDGAGNLITSFVKTNSDSGPTSVTVSNSHKVRLTAEGEHSDGLQKLWMTVSGHCRGTGTVQNIGYGLPTSGNAIPSNTTPTRFSFSEEISIAGQCNAGSLDLSVIATATSAPTTGIFGGGPATSSTQPAQFNK